MNVLALNSSPRSSAESKTELMLNHLVGGMREAGAEMEVIGLRDKKIKNCIGCFTCWTKTPGICVHNDDMTKELFPKWLASELVVYASPLYHYTINAAMKAFIERTLPVLEPFFEQIDGQTRHPLRHETPAAVVLAVAGFPEDSVFDQLSNYVNFMFGSSRKLLAEIYRSGADIMPRLEKIKDDILEATVQAGRELVKDMKIAPQTMARIRQPIIDFDTFAKLGKMFWKSCIAEGVTPKMFEEKGLIPRPDSIDTFILVFKIGFNAQAAENMQAVLQFDFSGEVTGTCYFTIEDGRIDAQEGTAEFADLTIVTPFEVWMDIMTGKAEGQQMFMEQKYQVSGNIELLMRMGALFGS